MPYPCLCTPLSIDPPAPCPSGNCLIVPGMTINPTTSVLPCGGVGAVDVAAVSDLTHAVGTVNWYLVSHNSTAFTSASVNISTGVLSFTASADGVPGTFYDFVVYAKDSGSLLSAYATIRVPIKDACYGVVCGANESCNPCTGACVAVLPDNELI